MDGVISVLVALLMVQLKLMSFVISWDTLELQATLDLECKFPDFKNDFFYVCRSSYGIDYLSPKLYDVDCSSSNYISIAQCSFSTDIGSGCTDINSYDATVYCCKFRD